MGFRQSLLASASRDELTASINKYAPPNTIDANSVVGSNGQRILSTPLDRNIIPKRHTNVNIGTQHLPIKELHVKNIYVKKDGLNFIDNKNIQSKSPIKSKIDFNSTKNEFNFVLNEEAELHSSGSINFQSTSSMDEIIEIAFVSNSLGYMDPSLFKRAIFQDVDGGDRQTYLSYVFRGNGDSSFSLTPSGGFYNTGSTTSETAENLKLVINNFASGSVSASIFPFTASVSASSELLITTTLSGSKTANIINYISSSTDLVISGTGSFSDGILSTNTLTGSHQDYVRDIAGGMSQIESASFSFKTVNPNGVDKNLFRISGSEDILQLGEETQENRFWKFKKDGRIVYSPSNTSDTYEVNVSESFSFSKVEDFGSGTKTEFQKTKGDSDETKRVTDVSNIRLPYNKGITLVAKDGTDTIGGFGITTTDISASNSDFNVENVIRFKGAGGFNFQNGAGYSYFHIDRLGRAAFGGRIAADHWDAGANMHISGSTSTDVFRITTDKDLLNIKGETLAVSGSLSVSGSIQGNVTTTTNHAYYDSSLGERNWIPFSPLGTRETTDWSDESNVEYRFLAPHNGQLKRIMIRNNYTSTASLGETKIAMSVWPELTGSEEASKNVDFNTGVDFDFSASTFSRGDLLGVYLQPSGSPRYVNVTCVWEYDTRS